MNTNEKLWRKIHSYWETFKVPNIEFIKFEFEKDYVRCPWYSNTKKRQCIYESNAIIGTAHHLAVYLKDKSPDFIAAYKIHSFLRENRKEYLLRDVFSFVFTKNNENVNSFWHPNAKNLFPYIDCYDHQYLSFYNYIESDWKLIVEHSAHFWKLLSEQWSIILVPDFMDENSLEYKHIREVSNKRSEEEEYQNYLRLKEKYDK